MNGELFTWDIEDCFDIISFECNFISLIGGNFDFKYWILWGVITSFNFLLETHSDEVKFKFLEKFDKNLWILLLSLKFSRENNEFSFFFGSSKSYILWTSNFRTIQFKFCCVAHLFLIVLILKLNQIQILKII